ncbi:hypothetical protein JCM13664_21810 [Methylothermus subterraneus]
MQNLAFPQGTVGHVDLQGAVGLGEGTDRRGFLAALEFEDVGLQMPEQAGSLRQAKVRGFDRGFEGVEQ